MEGFRRFVIGTAEICAIIGIVIATIAGGVTGASMGQYSRAYGGVDHSGLYALLGLVIGLLLSVLAASFLFTLTEIANNTRASLEILRGGRPAQPSAAPQASAGVAGDAMSDPYMPDPQMSSDMSTESNDPFEQINRDVSEAALGVLRQARDAGFNVTMMSDGKGIAIAKGRVRAECRSNWEVCQFGKQQGWK